MKELNELVEANIITVEKAEEIRQYFDNKKNKPDNRLVIVFGVLGALLVGLGIILIVAHNWDSFTKPMKLFFAFFPLIAAQTIALYVLLKKSDQIAWREASSTFLFFTIASSISIVSQVYNIAGDLAGFLKIWMILGLPIIYVMRSSMASLLYLIGITWYACDLSYFHYLRTTAYQYWILFALTLPYYLLLLKKAPKSNFSTFHNWFIVFSITITLNIFASDAGEWMRLAYIAMFGMMVMIGQLKPFAENKFLTNAYLIVGRFGTAALALSLTFDDFWGRITVINFYSQEMGVTLVLMVAATAVFIKVLKNHAWNEINVLSYSFAVFALLTSLGIYFPATAQGLANLVVLAMGVVTINTGAKKQSIGTLNYGLFIVATLITCRFFDTDLSFVVRGILFVLVGTGFFAANYWVIKKKAQQNIG